MKKMALIAAIATVLTGPAHAQKTISDVICETSEALMGNVVLGYRARGIPVGSAENIFTSVQDINTRLFLTQVTREIYANPEAGREYLKSGQFRAACVKIHRGY